MKKITNLQIDTSEMATTVVSRAFTVTGENGAKFLLYILQDDTLKYYDFVDNAFELGHNNKNNNLEVVMSGTSYSNSITFPSGGGSYTVKLLASSDTEIVGSNKHVISKSIDKQSASAIITFTPVTTNTSNYATFPTTTTTGALTDTSKFTFDWDVTNASTDGGGFGLRLTGTVFENINEKYWYFTTTDTVDGAISPTDENEGYKVQVDDLTDIGLWSYISAVSSGSLSGTPYITAIEADTKTLTLSSPQTFADGITLTFKAQGTEAISNAIDSKINFDGVVGVEPIVLTKTVRADVSSSTTITLNGTYGIAGGNHITYTGVGVDNSSANAITSVSASSSAGSMVVQNAQTLEAGTVLTLVGVHQVIKFIGNIKVSNYPSANKTIYLDIDSILTVGAAS